MYSSASALQKLVETAMLAAVTGLFYLATASLGLDKHMSFLLPMPILIATVRRGSNAGVWALATSACLITGAHACD